MTGERTLLTVGMLVLVGLLYLLMLKGWRGRLRRQGDLPPPPAPPAEPGQVLVPATAGLFIGTTFAGDWLDRVAVHDLAHRAAGWVLVDSNGVHVEREGLPELYLPFDAVEHVSLGEALAGKVIGKEGMVLVDWRLGGRLLTSGFRADDHAVHRRLVDAVAAQVREPPSSTGTAPPVPPSPCAAPAPPTNLEASP